MPYKDKAKKREHYREWRKTHPAKKRTSAYSKYARKVKKDRMLLLNNNTKLERGGACELCGYNKNLAALIWHHRDPTQKEHTVGVLVGNFLINKFKEEVKKCSLICANCHMIYHFADKEKQW